MPEPEESIMNYSEIIATLPHRYPFLLVDKVLRLDLEKGEILAQKNVSANEAFFQGHFPGKPLMPGVLITEALAQAGCLLFKKKIQTDKIPIFLYLNKVKFRKPVGPGDVLYLHAEGLHLSSKGGKIQAKAYLPGKVVACEAEIGFALVSLNEL